MFSLLPLTMFFSFLLWAAIIYTILGCAQLMLLERMIKKEAPAASTYMRMSPENKKAIHRQLLKVFIGLGALIVLAVIDHYLVVK